METVQINDKRALSLILFKKLTHDLKEFDDDMTEKTAARLIAEAVSLIPGFTVTRGEKAGIIYIKKEDSAGSDDPRGTPVNIQDAIDSLIIVWEDYQKLSLSA